MSKLTPKTEKAKKLFVNFPIILKSTSVGHLTDTHKEDLLIEIREILILGKFIKSK